MMGHSEREASERFMVRGSPSDGQPYYELLSGDYLLEGPVSGTHFWTPKGAKLFYGVKKMIESEIVRPAGFEEVVLPKTVSFETWLKSHIMTSYSNEPYTFFSLSGDTSGIREKAFVFKEFPAEVMERAETTQQGFSHSVCPPIYSLFEEKSTSLPVQWFDFSGPSLRNEGEYYRLEKLREFHLMVYVTLGTPEQVIGIRKQVLELEESLLDRLDLHYRLKYRGIDLTIDSPNELDIEARLPKEGTWTEIGNINLHGTRNTKSFGIGENLFTCCAGSGIERWVAAIVAHHGLDFPEPLLEHMEG